MAIISAQHPWDPSNPAGSTLFHEENGALLQWPVKLWKISSVSPFFHNAHLLISADCAAYACAQFHEKFCRSRIPLICCPESDFDISIKLSEILSLNDIRSITVVKMDSPCCQSLYEQVTTAVKLSKKPLLVQATTLFIEAEVID